MPTGDTGKQDGMMVGPELPASAPLRAHRQTFEMQHNDTLQSAAGARGQTDTLEEEDTEIQSFLGYYSPTWKVVLFHVLGFLTCGLVFLLTKWSIKLYILLRLAPCVLEEAEAVLVQAADGQVTLVRVTVILRSESGEPEQEAGSFTQHKDDALLGGHVQVQHRLLEFRCGRYFYVPQAGTFLPVPATAPTYMSQLQQVACLLPSAPPPTSIENPMWRLLDRQLLYGANEMKIPRKTLGSLIFDEMWHPFYVFQYFSMFVWVVGDNYYTFTVCIALITWFSIVTSAYDAFTNTRRLADMAHYVCKMEVLRGGQWVSLPSTDLVPGDVLTIRPGVLPCDVTLLTGECIVDENMLTGESVPVRKVPFSPVADARTYDPDATPGCTLYGGTLVAQARATRAAAGSPGRPLGMVARTGFYSAKGALLRSILFPREHEQAFISDSLKFICMMLIGCLAMYVWSAVVLWRVGAPAVRIAWRFFDMVTIAVPPALPACLAICIIFAMGRLRDLGVFVTSPDRIAMAGHLEVICFDKTGTLTQPGLHLKGVLPVTEDGAFMPVAEPTQAMPPLVEQLLATCHGLARMGDTLVGDPLDQRLFEATGWSLIDDSQEPPMMQLDPSCKQQAANLFTFLEGAQKRSGFAPEEQEHPCTYVRAPRGDRYAILRRFEFASTAQRSGVLVQAPDGRVRLFVKGSPEVVRGMVRGSSVPAEFEARLGAYTREGLRVLALAVGEVTAVGREKLMALTQADMEAAAGLRLLGLAAMENPLRADSAEVVVKLQTANIRCAMVTGDHVRTAMSVAHHCSLLSEHRPVALVEAGGGGGPEGAGITVSVVQPDGESVAQTTLAAVAPQIMTGEVECAITGRAFRTLVAAQDAPHLAAVLQRASVFARMSPDDKRDLMQLLGDGLVSQEARPGLGLFVGFCGDGANDCGALKAAHVGVSLCEAEASVAAPMTSKVQSIACMVMVVAEGRCTLMATYQIFQFIIGYALVQALSTNLMYMFALDMGNYQYLIQDLFFTTVSASLMGYTAPRRVLARDRPLKRVMSAPLLASTVAQLLVVVLFQCVALAALQARPGYVATQGGPKLQDVKSPENSTIYLTALAQYIILAIIFNKGYPHRSPLYTNLSLAFSLVGQSLFLIVSLFTVNTFNRRVQQLVDDKGLISQNFRGVLLAIFLANLAAAVVAELLLTPLLVWLVAWVRSARLKRA